MKSFGSWALLYLSLVPSSLLFSPNEKKIHSLIYCILIPRWVICSFSPCRTTFPPSTSLSSLSLGYRGSPDAHTLSHAALTLKLSPSIQQTLLPFFHPSASNLKDSVSPLSSKLTPASDAFQCFCSDGWICFCQPKPTTVLHADHHRCGSRRKRQGTVILTLEMKKLETKREEKQRRWNLNSFMTDGGCHKRLLLRWILSQ